MSDPFNMADPKYDAAYKQLFNGHGRDEVLASLSQQPGDFGAVASRVQAARGYAQQAIQDTESLMHSLVVSLDQRATPPQIRETMMGLGSLRGQLTINEISLERAQRGAEHLNEYPDAVERYSETLQAMLDCAGEDTDVHIVIGEQMRDAIEKLDLPAAGAARLHDTCTRIEVMCEMIEETVSNLDRQVYELVKPQLSEADVQIAELPPVAQIAQTYKSQTLEP